MVLRTTAILATVILIFGGLQVAHAANIDGRVTSSDGYGAATATTVMLDGGSTHSATADLYMVWTSGGDLDVALVLPDTTLVDTTYRPKDSTVNSLHSTWGSTKHDFSKLKKSDSAPIRIKDGSGTAILDVVMDFLDQDSSGNWRADLNGDGDTGTGSAYFGDSASSMVFNLTDSLVDWGSRSDDGIVRSPLLNSPNNTAYASTEAANWEYEVIYEFRIESGLFTGLDTSALKIVFGEGYKLHVSPDKTGKSRIYIPPSDLPGGTPPSSAVPLPSGAWMGLLALGGLGLMRRFRLRRQSH